MGVTSDLDIEIGQRLRRMRLSKGLTQIGLAKKIGISFQQLQKYENGSNRISASRLWDISLAFGIRPAYFFDDLGSSQAENAMAVGESDELADRTIRLAQLLNDMPDGRIKDELIGLIRAFAHDGANDNRRRA